MKTLLYGFLGFFYCYFRPCIKILLISGAEASSKNFFTPVPFSTLPADTKKRCKGQEKIADNRNACCGAAVVAFFLQKRGKGMALNG